MKRNRYTRIIATLGPSSSSREMIAALVDAGADVFRLNASHGTHDEMKERYDLVRSVEREKGRPIGILVDLQGPKLRVGIMTEGVVLHVGQSFRLDLSPTAGTQERAPLPHPEIISALQIGSTLLLNDGKIALVVTEKGSDFVLTTVKVGGALTSKKGVNVPDVILPLSALTEKDKKDLDFALTLGADWIALSFVQKAKDVLDVKEYIHGRAALMAKIEKPSAVEDADAIITAADGVMVARGDLGVEMPNEMVPAIQKRLIQIGRQKGKPVVVATQMLESMIQSPVPTRAEVSDVANAVFEGTDAVMLSAESAAGDYPIEAVKTMDRVARTVESTDEYRVGIAAHRCQPEGTSSDAITAAARTVAETIGAMAIVTYTSSGSTALRASRERPLVPIIVLTPKRETARRLAIVWGLNLELIHNNIHSFRETVADGSAVALREKFAKEGDKIVITAGLPFGLPGTTNVLRIARIGMDI